MKQINALRVSAASAAPSRTVQAHPVEVLTFAKGNCRATIATDGHRHVSQISTLAKEHSTLKAAISYLESKGYEIDMFNYGVINNDNHNEERKRNN